MTVSRGSPRLSFFAIAILLVFCVSQPETLAALQARWHMTVGSTYVFETSSHILRESAASDRRDHDASDASGTVIVHVLAGHGNIRLLDIAAGERHLRRLLRDDGTILGSFAESAEELPFLLLFSGDRAPNTPWRIERNIAVSGRAVPVRIDIVYTGRDAAKGTVSMRWAGAATLPSDQAIQRRLSIKGSAVFDEKKGCLQSGEWSLDYTFDLAAKEIAVIRPMWTFRETRATSCRLKEVTTP